MGDHQGFTVVLRGYDVDDVHALLERTRKALASSDPEVRAAVRAELSQPDLRVHLRGYDRAEVDTYLRRALDRLT